MAPPCSKVRLELLLTTDLAEFRGFLSWAFAWDFGAF